MKRTFDDLAGNETIFLQWFHSYILQGYFETEKTEKVFGQLREEFLEYCERNGD